MTESGTLPDSLRTAFKSIKNNIYHLNSGQNIASPDNGATVISNLVDWNTYLSGILPDNSQEINSNIVSLGGKIPSILPDTSGEIFSKNGGYVGSQFSEIGWYTANIMFDDAILTNVELNQSGVVLESGFSTGNIELGPLNIGADTSIEKILDVFIGENLGSGILVDSDLSDNAITSGEITIEMRRDETLPALSGKAYSLYNLREDEIPSSLASGQFLQVKLTLNE